MNIVLIVADQYRHDCLSARRHPVVETPNLDGLAADGTLFTRSYCATMACGPARASLFTGYYADTHGMSDNQTTLVPGDFPVLPEHLARAGYDTALVGKLHLKLAFPGPGAPGEDIKNQGSAVNYLYLKGIFKVALLKR